MILSGFSLELAKSTQQLTQMVSHPVLWHLIKEISPSGMLSPQRHRDRPLMSWHLCLRPAHVSSESKNKRLEPEDWCLDPSGIGLYFICACPVCAVTVVSELRTWDPDGSLAGVRCHDWNGLGVCTYNIVGALDLYIHRSARKHISMLNITHNQFPSLVSRIHYELQVPSQVASALFCLLHPSHPTPPPPHCGHCCGH